MSSYSDFANATSDILLKKGEALAQAKSRSGELIGSTIARLGDQIPQQVQQAIAQNAAKRKTAQIQSIIQQNGGDLDKSLPLIMGVDATIGQHLADEHAKVQKSVAEVQEIQNKAKKEQLDFSDRLWSGVTDEGSYARAALVSHSLGEQVPDQYDPDWVKQKKQSLLSMKDQLDLSKPMVVGPNLVSPQGKVIFEGEPKAPPQPTQASLAADLSSDDPAIVARAKTALDALKPTKDTSITPYQQAELDLSKSRLGLSQQREAREGAQQAAANAPPLVIKPGTAEYRIAQDLASGKMTFSQFRTLAAYNRNAALKFGIYDTARQLNPEFDPAQYELGFKMASNPAIRQRIVAINALGPVIDQIDELASKSGNTDIPAFNRLLNGAKFQLGNTTITNFRQLQTLLGDEVGNALGLGSGSDLKTRLGLDLVNPNLSPANFKATMEQLRSVLDARRAQLYKQMGVYGAGVEGAGAAPQPAAPSAVPGLTYQDYLKSKGGK